MTDPSGLYSFELCDGVDGGAVYYHVFMEGDRVGALRNDEGKWAVLVQRMTEVGFDIHRAREQTLDGAARQFVQMHQERLMRPVHHYARM